MCPCPCTLDDRLDCRAYGAKTRPDGRIIFQTAASPMRDAVQRTERERRGVFTVGRGVGGLRGADVGHDSGTVELHAVQRGPVKHRPLISALRAVRQRTRPLFLGPRPPRLDDEDVVFVVAIHAAFVEVDGGVSAAGTLAAVNEVKAAQTSAAVLALQFSYSPLGL